MDGDREATDGPTNDLAARVQEALDKLDDKTSPARCEYVRPDGTRCLAHSMHASAFCWSHNPDTVDARKAARSKGGRVSAAMRSLSAAHVAGVGDLLAVLSWCIDECLELSCSPLKRSLAISRLAATYSSIAQASDLEARVSRLEAKADAT